MRRIYTCVWIVARESQQVHGPPGALLKYFVIENLAAAHDPILF